MPPERKKRKTNKTGNTSEKLSCESDTSTGNRYYESDPFKVLWRVCVKHETLSPRDVLRCRCVSKDWRDTATSYLREHNLFELVFKLEERETRITPGGATNFCPRKKLVNARQPTSSMSDLITLIFTSSSFPTTSIRFRQDIGDGSIFGDLFRSADPLNKLQWDLLKLWVFYGSEIKCLTLPSEFPAQTLYVILHSLMTQLEVLDLQFFEGFSERAPLCYYPESTGTLKTIILSEHFRDNQSKLLRDLLGTSWNLEKIQNVNICALGVLLEAERSSLIYSLICKPSQDEVPILAEFGKYLTNPQLHLSSLLRPKLTEITLSFSAIHHYCNDYKDVFVALNSILEGCKDILKILDLRIIPVTFHGCKPKIPPMPQLEFLVLSDDVLYNSCPFFTSRGTRDRRIRYQFSNHFHEGAQQQVAGNIPTSSYDLSTKIFLFSTGENSQEVEGKFPQECFPRLHKVQLNVRRDISSWRKLVGFFALESFKGDGNVTTGTGDRILKVTELEMPCFVLGSELLSKLFPHICELKITAPCTLRNSFWVIFPFLKKFEICENPPCDGKPPSVVDSFFTGIAESVCLRLLDDPDAGFGLSSAQVNLLVRTMPFIGNCSHLKEFRIKFISRLRGTFATKLSALYGFKELDPQKTKIVFSFESLGLSRKGIADMRKWLAPLKPFVHIET